MVYPKVSQYQNYKCNLVTRSLTLDTIVANPNFKGCKDPACILVIIAAYPVSGATTGIVSGSIAIAGNTIHWIEKQGRCSNSTLKKAASALVGSIVSSGGWIVEKKDDLVNWINEK